MQDIYAFDIGDFGKLGLLRHLAAHDLTLGVAWWTTELGSPEQDGKHLTYLNNVAYQRCDPDLWNAMRECVSSGPRSIAALQGLFPESTTFFPDAVPTDANRRLLWFDRAIASVRRSHVVFCDPDNGIAFTETTRSLRHISLFEIRQLYGAGHSLVVYHHLNRSCSHQEQIANGEALLRTAVAKGNLVWSAHFRRGTSRAYYVLPQHQHREAIAAALIQLRDSRWCRDGHFSVSLNL